MYGLLLPISRAQQRQWPAARANLAAQFLKSESSFNIHTVHRLFNTASLDILGKGTILKGCDGRDNLEIKFGESGSGIRFWAAKCAASGWLQLQISTVGEEEAGSAPSKAATLNPNPSDARKLSCDSRSAGV